MAALRSSMSRSKVRASPEARRSSICQAPGDGAKRRRKLSFDDAGAFTAGVNSESAPIKARDFDDGTGFNVFGDIGGSRACYGSSRESEYGEPQPWRGRAPQGRIGRSGGRSL